MAQYLIHGLYNTHCIQRPTSVGSNEVIEWLKSEIEAIEGLSAKIQHLQLSQWHSSVEDRLETCSVYLKIRIDGGKGGFGTQLRGGGAKQQGPINNDSSRDLEGRRLRDANALSKIKRALDKKQAALDGTPIEDSDEEETTDKKKRFKAQRKKQRLARQKNDTPELDPEEDKYAIKQRKEAQLRQTHKQVVEETAEAVEFGFKAVSSSKATSSSNSAPQSTVNMFGDIYGCAISSEEEEEEDFEDFSEESSSSEETVSPSVHVLPTSSSAPMPTPTEDKTPAREIKVDEEPERARDGLKRNHETMDSETLIDLMKYDNSVALEALGLDRLKRELDSRGLMVGGTLTQRAVRLFQVRGLTPEKYPAELLAKSKKPKQ